MAKQIIAKIAKALQIRATTAKARQNCAMHEQSKGKATQYESLQRLGLARLHSAKAVHSHAWLLRSMTELCCAEAPHSESLQRLAKAKQTCTMQRNSEASPREALRRHGEAMIRNGRVNLSNTTQRQS